MIYVLQERSIIIMLKEIDYCARTNVMKMLFKYEANL